MNKPFNQVAHDFLTTHGYSYQRVDEHWEDVGDPENGPDLAGHEAFDRYASPEEDHEVVIFGNGMVFYADLQPF